MNYEKKIQELGLVIPEAGKPVGSYLPVVLSGGLGFLSGQISKTGDGKILTGKVGRDLTPEQGKEAARVAGLNVISIVRNLIGFEKFERIVKVTGYVQTAPDFSDISAVVNGASDLFLEVFGQNGVHARSSLGMASLPLNAAVEIEVILQLK